MLALQAKMLQTM
jgi:hypothetical protein